MYTELHEPTGITKENQPALQKLCKLLTQEAIELDRKCNRGNDFPI